MPDHLDRLRELAAAFDRTAAERAAKLYREMVSEWGEAECIAAITAAIREAEEAARGDERAGNPATSECYINPLLKTVDRLEKQLAAGVNAELLAACRLGLELIDNLREPADFQVAAGMDRMAGAVKRAESSAASPAHGGPITESLQEVWNAGASDWAKHQDPEALLREIRGEAPARVWSRMPKREGVYWFTATLEQRRAAVLARLVMVSNILRVRFDGVLVPVPRPDGWWLPIPDERATAGVEP